MRQEFCSKWIYFCFSKYRLIGPLCLDTSSWLPPDGQAGCKVIAATEKLDSVHQLLHWSLMIDFINVFTDDNTLWNKYSLQYESFIWRNLNQRTIVKLIKVKSKKKNHSHNSFGWVNNFCSFILMILLSYQLYLLSIFLFY